MPTTAPQDNPVREFPTSTIDLSKIEEHLRAIAKIWKDDPHRPKIEEKVIQGWGELIKKWSENSSLPLIARCLPNCTGTIKTFNGRKVIFSDNSTAQWVFRKAYAGIIPNLDEIKKLIEAKQLPVAQIYTGAERKAAPYFYESILQPEDKVNNYGWRLAHLEAIGMNGLSKHQNEALEKLKKHFVKFLSPSNMLLIPSSIGAFGEIKTVLDAFVEDSEGTVPVN